MVEWLGGIEVESTIVVTQYYTSFGPKRLLPTIGEELSAGVGLFGKRVSVLGLPPLKRELFADGSLEGLVF